MRCTRSLQHVHRTVPVSHSCFPSCGRELLGNRALVHHCVPGGFARGGGGGGRRRFGGGEDAEEVKEESDENLIAPGAEDVVMWWVLTRSMCAAVCNEMKLFTYECHGARSLYWRQQARLHYSLKPKTASRRH
jgi:hypothetical protein